MLLILSTLGLLVFKGCRYDWSPHYIDNSAVTIENKLYSPDSSIAVVYYTLDVGGRGIREYKSLLREKDYDNDLTIYNLPPEITVVKWLDNKTLNVRYDPSEIYRLGATASELDITKDTIIVNGVNLVMSERIQKKTFAPY